MVLKGEKSISRFVDTIFFSGYDFFLHECNHNILTDSISIWIILNLYHWI